MQAAAKLVCICALFILANCSDDRVTLTLLQPGDTVLAFGDSAIVEAMPGKTRTLGTPGIRTTETRLPCGLYSSRFSPSDRESM